MYVVRRPVWYVSVFGDCVNKLVVLYIARVVYQQLMHAAQHEHATTLILSRTSRVVASINTIHGSNWSNT